MPKLSQGGLSHGQTACEAAGGRGQLTEKFHTIADSSPRNTLPKQEGLQLAEASFREKKARSDLYFQRFLWGLQ